MDGYNRESQDVLQLSGASYTGVIMGEILLPLLLSFFGASLFAVK